jgi:hypothetical protein
MNATRPLIIGHSHAGALFEAADAARLDAELMSFWLLRDAFHHDGERAVLGPALAEAIDRASVVVSAVGGGASRVLSLLGVVRPFDFVDPLEAQRPNEDGVEVVPFGAVRAATESHERVALDVLRAVVERARVPVVHVLPPHPTRRWEGTEALALTKLTAKLLGIDATPEHDSTRTHKLTLRLWRVMADVHRARCGELGVTASPPPPGGLRRGRLSP